MKKKILLKRLMFVMLQWFAFTTLHAQNVCSQAFTYTGADQTFTVPSNVHQIVVKLWGAGGAGGNYAFNDIGGGGGFASAVFNVNPGEQYIIIVGGGGLNGAGPGAYGGGGAKDCGVGGRGGGRSAIRNALNIELITAGAGGGGGGVAQAYETGGHGGGGLSGEPDNWLPYGGGAGTQTEGGIGGHRKPNDPNPNSGAGEPGGLYFGGKANCFDNGYNGSGGGGYYGGGSGTDYGDGAGGGGSSFIPGGGTTIAASSNIPGNISDNDYADNAGYGGAKATAGNAGRVVILWCNTCFAPTGLRVQDLTSTAAILKWQVAGVDILHVRVRYRAVGGTGWTIKNKQGDKPSVHIDGLTPNTTYQWQARSFCAEDTTGWIVGPDFTTAGSLNPGAKATAYPNPAKNTITVNYSASKNGKYIFEITSSNGNVVLRKEANAIPGANRITLDISRFFKGVYFINIIKPDMTREKIQLNKE